MWVVAASVRVVEEGRTRGWVVVGPVEGVGYQTHLRAMTRYHPDFG